MYTAEPMPDSTGFPLTVLLVDDDPISLSLLEEHLRPAGHRVLAVPSARGAAEVMRGEPVHLVIADWVMPGMSGLDLCRWVRSRRFDHPLHFVMLTMYSDRERLVEAFEAGGRRLP